MIDIKKFEHRINLLKQGKQLLLKHKYYGDYTVRMNPQHNRIMGTPYDSSAAPLDENGILGLLVWDCGEWYLFDRPHTHMCHCCNGTGKIQEEAAMEQV